MATLQELMAEVFGESSKEISKEASAAKTTSEEINEVLANLGLEDSETVKTAAESEKENNKGGSMGLMSIYEQIMNEVPAAEQEKIASEGEATSSSESTEETNSTTAFGELVGEYFNVMAEPFFDKIAGDLEAEAGAGNHPKGDLKDAKKEEPHLPVNHKPENGKALEVTTGGTSPYSLKEKALMKAILTRLQAGQVGNYKE